MRGSALRGLLQLRSRCVTPCICAAVPRGYGAAPRSLGAPFSSCSSGSGSGLTGGRLPTGGQPARPEHDGFAWQPLDNDPPHSARDVPCPTNTRVVDYAGALTPEQAAALDKRLAALHDAAGGAEVLVLTLRDIRACTGWRGAAMGGMGRCGPWPCRCPAPHRACANPYRMKPRDCLIGPNQGRG